MKDFVDLAGLELTEVHELLELSRRLQREPEPAALAGRVLGLLFFNPSLRTLASMQAGMAKLGGSSFVITPGATSWQLETRTGIVMDGAAAEHIREAIPVLASYCDALGIRSFAGGSDLAADVGDLTFRAMQDVCPKPLINLESAISHPCQSLADWRTMDDFDIPTQGGRFVLAWANHPKPLPLAVPASTVQMAALRGMDVVVLRPDGYGLPEEIMRRARRAAERSGGSVRETDQRDEALEGAHVVYAKSWSSTAHYGDAAADLAHRAGLRDWCVRSSWFEHTAADCRFMHCLPVRRNVVVEDDVLDGPRSIVLAEAANRMTVQMAVLHRMMSA